MGEAEGPDRPHDCHQEQPCRRNCLKLRLREGTVEEVNYLLHLDKLLDVCNERSKIKSYQNPCDTNTIPMINKSPHRKKKKKKKKKKKTPPKKKKKKKKKKKS